MEGRERWRGGIEDKRENEEDFARRFPEVPTAGLAARDYASYSEEQRNLVMELLLAGRFDLALSGRLADGREVLVTHAGVTSREVGMRVLQGADARRIAEALQVRLRQAVDDRRAAWAAGDREPLSLEPLHVAGRAGVEGGGLLYHGPARSDRPDADAAWEQDPQRPRRFVERAWLCVRPAARWQLRGFLDNAEVQPREVQVRPPYRALARDRLLGGDEPAADLTAGEATLYA